MDFFARQDEARRKTRHLVLLFLLAVVAMVTAVYLAALLVFGYYESKVGGQLGNLWRPELFLWVSATTLAIITGGSLYKTASLARGGGEGVAQLLGGRPIAPDTSDLAERRVLNVVEEMALAAGTAVPSVFLLEKEKSINAFAAGFTPQTAVVAVTRGALDNLDRDELQGVIGHEMSHILNGDMHLNIRLMGVLHGILVIALIGYWVLRFAPWGGGGDKREKGSSVALFGLALLVIGYLGVFFGKLIKSAVSRQREFLADASSVQFTRNPAGLVGALEKIGAKSSRLGTHNAEEASHSFFANGVGGAFLAALATHPPLAERIRRLDPSYEGTLPEEGSLKQKLAAELGAPTKPSSPATPGGGVPGGLPFLAGAVAAAATPLTPAAARAAVGSPERAHLDYAAAFLRTLPAELDRRAREPFGARALVCALLLDADDGVRARQLALLPLDDAPFRQQVGAVQPAVDRLPAAGRLPLLDLCLPALRQLSPEQYATFSRVVESLVHADGEVDLFEYTLQRVLLAHLAPWFGRAKANPAGSASLPRLAPRCAVLLSALAYAGVDADDLAGAAEAFARGWSELGEGLPQVHLLPREECTFARLDAALAPLACVAATGKRKLVGACTACVAADGRVTLEEGELLRAITDALGAPLPPLLGSPPAA